MAVGVLVGSAGGCVAVARGMGVAVYVAVGTTTICVVVGSATTAVAVSTGMMVGVAVLAGWGST